MTLFSGGSGPSCKDTKKSLDSGAGAVDGANGITYKPNEFSDGFKINNLGHQKNYALRVTFSAATGYTIGGQANMLIPAGYSDSVTFDDAPADGNAIDSVKIELVDLSGIAVGDMEDAQDLPAAPATTPTGDPVVTPFTLSFVES